MKFNHKTDLTHKNMAKTTTASAALLAFVLSFTTSTTLAAPQVQVVPCTIETAPSVCPQGHFCAFNSDQDATGICTPQPQSDPRAYSVPVGGQCDLSTAYPQCQENSFCSFKDVNDAFGVCTANPK